jgi:hypothetical protein
MTIGNSLKLRTLSLCFVLLADSVLERAQRVAGSKQNTRAVQLNVEENPEVLERLIATHELVVSYVTQIITDVEMSRKFKMREREREDKVKKIVCWCNNVIKILERLIERKMLRVRYFV